MVSGSTEKLIQEITNENLPAGYSRFIVQLSKLYYSLSNSAQKEDPASFLFDPVVRQNFFYLEALSRIYRKIHDRKMFDLLRNEFKMVEDQLGKIDFYDGWVKEFSQQKNFPPELNDYFNSHRESELENFRKLLEAKNWINNDYEMVRNILSDLSSAAWMNAADDRRAIAVFLDDELDDLKDDYEENRFDFNNIEEGVHEFRRQLRWFSIYAQALDGLIQLKNSEEEENDLKKYLTAEVLNSPYNSLPVPKQGIIPLYIRAPEFYALSWMVNELGNLKDDGLRFNALWEAVEATHEFSEEDAEAYISSLAGRETLSLEEIPQIVAKMCNEFMHEDDIIKKIRKDIKAAVGLSNYE